jgi:aminopeptidase YwaD
VSAGTGWLRLSLLALATLVLSTAACQTAPAPEAREAARPAAEPARLMADVVWLAHPEREGRRAGQPGEWAAGTWLAGRLADLGLEPAGEQGWFQSFEVPLPPRDRGDSRVRFTTRLGEGKLSAFGSEPGEAVPLFCSGSGSAEGALVFAGYGLVESELELDDYAGLDVAGRVVLIVRGLPQDRDGVELEAGGAAGLFHKVMSARRRGAAAVLVAPHPRDAEQALPPFDSGATALAALPALVVPVGFAERLLPDYRERVARLDRALTAGVAGRAEAAELLGDDGRDTVVQVHADVERGRAPARNVLGRVRGDGTSAHTIVIGAHYDHLGLGETGSLAPGDVGRIHPGADDNASGVAVALEAARLLAAGPAPAGDVLIALWSGEELGLLGSKHWLRAPTVPLERVAANLNLDMVGRGDDGRFQALGAGSAAEFAPWLADLGPAHALELTPEPSGRALGGSDHQGFLERGIPALHFFSGLHGDYHRPRDTADLFEADGAARLSALLVDLVGRVQRTEALAFVPVPEPPAGERMRGGTWRVLFGAVPGDYADPDPGLLIGGTTAGSPAERAGLLAGDRILWVGDVEILAIADFVHALSVHKPGETVTVRFERDGEDQEVLLTFALREAR